jgi:hypothetical protein
LVKEREKKRKFALNPATLQSETCAGRPVPFLSLKRTLAMVFFLERCRIMAKRSKDN